MFFFLQGRSIREFIFGFKAKDTLPSAITIDELLKNL